MTKLSNLIINSYANFLKAKGEVVLDIGGISWMKYHGALIPAAAMPVYINLSKQEALRETKKTNALFIRYTTGPISTVTNWWYIVCRNYDFDRVSSNTRSKIRRGLRRLEIERVSPEWLSQYGYQCHVESYKRYKQASPKTEKDFIAFIDSLRGESIFEIWACRRSEYLVGYIICLKEDDGIFMHTIDITPAGLHDYAAYAMIHHILEYYVNQNDLPVSNGSRSIAHATDMQDFLCKLGFEREYAQLHVVYRPDVKLIVSLLYPLRNVLKHLKGITFVNRVSAVLFQEEIIRTGSISKISP